MHHCEETSTFSGIQGTGLGMAINVSHMVQEIGMVAEWTLSGKEAVLRTKVAVEQNREFGAYIIDWMMPDLNGIETVRRIRQIIGDSRPIIAMTANAFEEDKQKAFATGMNAHIAKPIEVDSLLSTIAKVLG